MDLVPTLARLYFIVLPKGKMSLSPVQAIILTGIGLQFKTIDMLQGDMNLQANQMLPLFNKAIRKFARLVKDSYAEDVATKLKE